MPQDAFTLRLNAAELNAFLKGGRINKINQPDKEEVSLIIYTGKRTVKLALNVNASFCGVYFSEAERENPLVAPNFCMLLRKHLQGAEILGVETAGFERVLCFRLRCVSDFSSCERVLYAEIMGKYSNLVLTENGVILGALKTTALDANTKRIVFSGVKYALPSPQDKVNPQDREALETLLKEPQGDLAHFLFTYVAGLAPCTAEQIAESYRGGSLAKHVYDFIFSDEIFPCVLERENVPVDFFARKKAGAIPFETLSAAQEYFYGVRGAAKEKEQFRRTLLSAVNGALKKQEKRLGQIVEKQRECANAEENRIKGELVTSNLYALTKGMKGCELDNYYDEKGGTMKIALDPMLTPAENAHRYYAKYRKQKRTVEILAPQEEEVRAETDYALSLLAALSCADSMEDLRSIQEEMLGEGLMKAPPVKNKKKAPEVPFRTFEKDGFKIFAGRNNLQNDKLVKRGAPEDIWLHAQKYHSCHVIVKTEGRKVPDEVLLFAAQICARYSDGKGDKIPVDYCLLKHVKKPPKCKAGFVLYTDYKTILTAPMPL